MKAVLPFLILAAFAGGAFGQAMQPVLIGWHGLADKTTTGYHVYFGTQPGVYSVMFNCGPAEFVTINALVPGYVIVKPYNRFGIEGLASNEIHFTPVPLPSPSPTATPATTPASPLTIKAGTPTPTPKTL